MDILEIELALLRLKEMVKVKTDKDIAALLGMDVSAFHKRKKRNSFPTHELLAIAEARPDLGIDTHYVFTGERLKDSVTEAVRTLPQRVREIRDSMSEIDFAAAWGIGAAQLAQIESGQRPPTADLLKRLAQMRPDDASYLLTGRHPQLKKPLTGREVVLVSNYRACSDEGRDALSSQANFLAQYNAQHAPVNATMKSRPVPVPTKKPGKLKPQK